MDPLQVIGMAGCFMFVAYLFDRPDLTVERVIRPAMKKKVR